MPKSDSPTPQAKSAPDAACICKNCRHAIVRDFNQSLEGEGPQAHIICDLLCPLGPAFGIVWQQGQERIFVKRCTHFMKADYGFGVEKN
tara:strand:+ start:1992 stop:2258 length:267 start_codon:yes stop_codon:yes gene_type:complete